MSSSVPGPAESDIILDQDLDLSVSPPSSKSDTDVRNGEEEDEDGASSVSSSTVRAEFKRFGKSEEKEEVSARDLIDLLEDGDEDEEANKDDAPEVISPESVSSAKENVEPAPKSKKPPTYKSKGIMQGYTSKKRKRRASSQNAGNKRGRRPSGASSTVSDGKSVVSLSSTATTAATKGGKSDEEDSDDTDNEGQGEDVFVVERIDDKQEVEGTMFYFIKWKGWEASANTWEPIENLDGCSELLEAFEKRRAESGEKRKKKATPKKRGAPANRKKSSVDDDEDDFEVEVVGKTQNNMKCYGVLDEWPADKDPISVEGVISGDGVLTYVVKKKARLGSETLDRTNAVLVKTDGFKKWYPELVIDFYQRRVLWCDSEKDEEDKAKAAAMMSLLQKYNGTKIGRKIAEDIDKEAAKAHSDVEGEEAGLSHEMPLPSTTAETEARSVDQIDLKTQLVDAKSEQDEDDMEVDVEDDSAEDDPSFKEGSKLDKFGLPQSENTSENNTSGSTVATDSDQDEGDDEMTENVDPVAFQSHAAVSY